MVSYEGEKMSKSLGNLVFVSDLLKVADPRAIRLALMRHHYRAGFEWYDTDLDEGNALLRRLLAAAERSDGADPRPFARAGPRRARRRPRTRRGRSRRSTTSPARCCRVDRTQSAPDVLCDLGELLGLDLKRPIEPGRLITTPCS